MSQWLIDFEWAKSHRGSDDIRIRWLQTIGECDFLAELLAEGFDITPVTNPPPANSR